jgi:hypothetical protein
MEITTIQTAVCKSVQSLGIEPRKEHQIENAIAKQLSASGPEFLLRRISDLTDWRKMQMSGDTQYHPDWHRYRVDHGVTRPTDPLGAALWKYNDKTFFAVCGSISKAVELAIPTEKQLLKWKDGVRCQRTSDPTRKVLFEYPEKVCKALETDIARRWTERGWFSVSDITGTNIPGSGKYVNVRRDKFSPEKKDPYSLLSAYGFSVSTAPLFVWQFFKDIGLPGLLAQGQPEFDEDLVTSLEELIDAKLGDYRLQDEAEIGSSMFDDEAYLADKGDLFDPVFGFAHSVGSIGFLEQGKGKLRTVANPNRLVQYANFPLGEALAKVFYRIPECYVLNQAGGLEWAQSKLREGVRLNSFDMSAASDRLDYSKFLHEAFAKVYQEPDKFPLLSRSLELFEDTSSCPWTIPGYVADLIGSHTGQISWSVGQPLGLRPSFPVLSEMNAMMARCAVKQVDGKYTPNHFAVVGDDLIIESRYADAYMEWVTAYNGKINSEKAMESDRYAEFCSQLVTKSTSYPLKPRYILSTEGSLQNVEKFSTQGLDPKVPKWAKELHNSISQWHLDGYDTIQYSSTNAPKSLMERLSVNALIKAVNPAERDPEKVTLQTLYVQGVIRSKDKTVQVKDLSTSWASKPYEVFGGTPGSPVVSTKHLECESALNSQNDWSEFGTLGQVSTDRSTSVDLSTNKHWDYQQARYTKPVSQILSAKRLEKTLSNISTLVDDNGIVESAIDVKGRYKYSVLVDTRQRDPEILLAILDKDNNVYHVDDISDTIPDQARAAYQQCWDSLHLKVPEEILQYLDDASEYDLGRESDDHEI